MSYIFVILFIAYVANRTRAENKYSIRAIVKIWMK